VPAAAVIPAPRVYIRFVVVKKLVVETRSKNFLVNRAALIGAAEQSAASAAFLFFHRCSFNEVSAARLRARRFYFYLL